MRLEQVGKTCNAIMDEIGKAIVGKREIMERVILAVLCDGHLLFEDFPGLAKTLMAKSFAVASGCDFKRIQFTPDLLPADITGTYVFRRDGGSFDLRKGPVFANILLADEINRAPPKTQAALLEAMQEKQVTLEGNTHPLPRPFIVLATQNPLEYEGTYPLPEAQVDRFLLKTEVGYPSVEEEREILDRRKERKREEVDLAQVCSPETIMEMQAAVEQVHVEDSMRDYIVSIVDATRNNSQLEVGASPRGSLGLMRLSMALAAINGRDYIIPDDVKKVAIPALAHRLILQPDPWIKGVRAEQILGRILMEIPVPKVE
ncbi:MAG: MoxR family ATPase [Methanomassiliicoccales archaeon]|nr:MoxR family ATPase [Methanomassiliicoccales archaeon]NYT15287.1 MoxR family ATPase [Methanomassiliicoccales archaeon]